MGVTGGEAAGFTGVFNQVAMAQLGQDGFKGAAKAVEHLDGILQRNQARAGDCVRGLDGWSGGSVGGMDEERGTAVDAGLEQANAFLGGAPGFDDNVVELFAEELIDYGFMRAADFKKIGQRADWCEVGAKRAGLEQAADGVSGVAVVANERFKGVAAAGDGGLFAADLVGAGALRIFFGATGLEGFAEGGDFRFEALKAVGGGLETQTRLATLHAKVFKLVARLAHFSFEARGFAFEGGKALFGLGGVVAGVAGLGEQVHGVAAA